MFKKLTFDPMRMKMGIRIILFFLVLVISSFDRHLSNYFPAEVQAMVQGDAVPGHSELPVKSCDSHEDIVSKSVTCDIPAPSEVSISGFQILCLSIPHVSPLSVWQPPENII